MNELGLPALFRINLRVIGHRENKSIIENNQTKFCHYNVQVCLCNAACTGTKWQRVVPVALTSMWSS